MSPCQSACRCAAPAFCVSAKQHFCCASVTWPLASIPTKASYSFIRRSRTMWSDLGPRSLPLRIGTERGLSCALSGSSDIAQNILCISPNSNPQDEMPHTQHATCCPHARAAVAAAAAAAARACVLCRARRVAPLKARRESRQ